MLVRPKVDVSYHLPRSPLYILTQGLFLSLKFSISVNIAGQSFGVGEISFSLPPVVWNLRQDTVPPLLLCGFYLQNKGING